MNIYNASNSRTRHQDNDRQQGVTFEIRNKFALLLFITAVVLRHSRYDTSDTHVPDWLKTKWTTKTRRKHSYSPFSEGFSRSRAAREPVGEQAQRTCGSIENMKPAIGATASGQRNLWLQIEDRRFLQFAVCVPFRHLPISNCLPVHNATYIFIPLFPSRRGTKIETLS